MGQHDRVRVLAKIDALVLDWVTQLAEGHVPTFKIDKAARLNPSLALKSIASDDDDFEGGGGDGTSAPAANKRSSCSTIIKIVPVRAGEDAAAKEAKRAVERNRRYAG